jgi:hypothetical protein
MTRLIEAAKRAANVLENTIEILDEEDIGEDLSDEAADVLSELEAAIEEAESLDSAEETGK